MNSVDLVTPGRNRRSSRAAFTLIELLIVIGIIAVLLSLLIPVVASVREQAYTVKCLSNLRQIGLAATTYATQNNGTLVPVSNYHANGDPTGRTWFDTWATILVAGKYLPYPRGGDAITPPSGENVFQCPSGILEMASLTVAKTANPIPASRKDLDGAKAYLHQSTQREPGLNVFAWYGINGILDENSEAWASRMAKDGKGLRSMMAIRNASRMAYFFDGLWGANLQNNANRLNARHKNQRVTNIAFYDGHAESFQTKDLPGGDGVALGSDFDVAKLKLKPYPVWRLDQ